LQHASIYHILSYKLHARYLQTIKDYKGAIEMAGRIEDPDEETEQIIQECKSAIEQVADK